MENHSALFAIVTGASMGIGRAISRELAVRKHNLILNSLPDQGLQSYCRELESEFGIKAYCIENDLTAFDGPDKLSKFVMQNSLRVNILVNNAGVGHEGPIEGYSKSQVDRMIMLNIRAVTMLTVLFTPELKKHPVSYILNLSSFGGYMPTPYKSIYLSTKSYIYHFTRSLETEFKGSSVRTCVAMPSGVRTNPNTLDRIKRNGWVAQKSAMNPEEVAACIIKGMFRGRKVILPGKLSNIFFNIGMLVPEGLILAITRKIFSNYRQC